jgi:hypothetical protein
MRQNLLLSISQDAILLCSAAEQLPNAICSACKTRKAKGLFLECPSPPARSGRTPTLME